jgi:hypothetical protein
MFRDRGGFGKGFVVLAFAVLISVTVLMVFSPKPAVAGSHNAKPADAFVDSIGVNTHLSFSDTVYEDYPLIKNKLTSLGVRHIRDHAHLNSYAPYNEKIYGKYRDLYNSGIRSNLMLSPRMLNLQSVDGEKVASIAEMAGPALESFEGPNEYDYSGDGQWAKVLRAYQQSLYDAVKNNESTANIPVIGPSLGSPLNSNDLGSLSSSLDYGNIHSYPGGQRPSAGGLTDYYVPNAKKVSGTKPLIATETGYHTAQRWTGPHPSVSEQAEGRYVPRLYLEYFNRGIKRTYGYELIDEHPDPENDEREKNFGLLRHDGTAKPAYTALKNLIGLLEDEGQSFQTSALDYTLSGATADVHRTLLQKRDRTFYLVLWVEKSSYDVDTQRGISVPSQRVDLTLNTRIARAATYLPNQSSSPVKRYASPQKLALQVPDHPLVVELTPSTSTNTAPKVKDVKPRRKARTADRTPTISATVTDAQSELVKSDIKVFVDGRQKQRFSYDRATDKLKFTSRRKLARGESHSIKIIARDDAGLVTKWLSRFKVTS